MECVDTVSIAIRETSWVSDLRDLKDGPAINQDRFEPGKIGRASCRERVYVLV